MLCLSDDVLGHVASFAGVVDTVTSMCLVSKPLRTSLTSGINAWITFWQHELACGPLPWQLIDQPSQDGNMALNLLKQRLTQARGPVMRILREAPFNVPHNVTCTTRKLTAASKENNTTNAQGDDGAEAQVQDEKAIASLAECESVLLADVSRAVQNPHFGSIHGEGGGVENDGGNCHLMIGPLSDAQIRAYQYWDLMAIAQQVPVEVEINHRSYQSFSVDPSDETVREMHACRRAGDTFRAVGYYGYNDNCLAVFVDVNGRPAAASGGGASTSGTISMTSLRQQTMLFWSR